MSNNVSLIDIQGHCFNIIKTMNNTMVFVDCNTTKYLENSYDGELICSDDLKKLENKKIIIADEFNFKSIDSIQIINYKIYTFITDTDHIVVVYIDKQLKY